MRLSRQNSSERGETIVEYVLMLGLIFLLVVLATVTVGDQISYIFNRVSDALFRR